MTIQDLSASAIARRTASQGLRFRAGPFLVRLSSPFRFLADQLKLLYPLAELPEDDPNSPTTFHIALTRAPGIRRWIRQTVHFVTDGEAPFNPFPSTHALPMFEWGLNWCIATQAHEYLQLHSAVVEKNDKALIMPAEPGSGKSTLCAALIHRGWRLLSDEFALIRPLDHELRVTPLPRPIPLKNQSITVIRAFAPDAVLGPVFPNTRKGDVAHVMPPLESQRRWLEQAGAGLIVFPRYVANTATALTPYQQSQAFIELSGNSFNYQILGERGFHALVNLIKRCPAYSLKFDSLDHAVDALDALIEDSMT